MAKLKISEETKEIINNGKDLINQDKFQEFFDELKKQGIYFKTRAEIGYLFYLTFGIDFLKYMDTITDYMFFGSNIGPNIVTPSSIIKIGQGAFQCCRSLKSIELPNVTKIGPFAFAECTNLKSISLPNVEAICTSAFLHCENLQTISLPKATAFGENLLGNCKNVTIELGKHWEGVQLSDPSFGGENTKIKYI